MSDSAAGHGGDIPITLSTASVYPAKISAAFATAARLGYDGVEIMVLGDKRTQEGGALKSLADHHDLMIHSIHAPTLLVSQHVYGTTDAWTKIDRSIDLAHEVGAGVVVVHPPFRWQRDYARRFAEGIAQREAERDIVLAVENMFPWKAGPASAQAYLPHWDPCDQPYPHVTMDLSHTATARSDAMDMVRRLGARLAHVHLADGSGRTTILDEHLPPGLGNQPCAEFLEYVTASGYRGGITLEVSTRRADPAQRDQILADSLAFARRHVAAGVAKARV
ncbi:sugar phosphate isomerase/epimerase family protein [Kribbia dieselivorans]|uniref:sugar phosphate isomerase/epimerase family protein n=1 Tax=Kribbia dieselivorans TaxID=331526 RepID=UPI0008385758|nr:sugar phosphate isomerase/epimerase [Kribbia dieselivorans]